MPKGSESYFGVALGQALAGGAGHISDALRRKYEMQRQMELEARQQRQQDIGTQATFAAKGIRYDPSQPLDPAIFDTLISQAQQQANLERRKTEAEITKLGRPQDEAPTGFRYTATGNLEEIPGGPAAQTLKKAEAEEKEKELGQEEFIGTLDRGIKAISETIGDVTWGTAGYLGVQAEKPSWWNMPANELAGKIQHIESIIGLKVIEKLKAQSRTGATGFGQLSEKELNLLTSNIANIKANLNRPETLRKNLKEVSDVLETWKDRSLKSGVSTGKPQLATSPEAAPSILPGLSAEESAEFKRLDQKFGGR